MQEILEDKFSSLTELLNKYESIGINVEEARKTLNSLNQEYYSKTKEELSSELNCFTNSLKTLDNYYKIITTTKYIRDSISSITSHKNYIDEYRNLTLASLKIIDELSKDDIKKEQKILREFYSVALEVSKLEILYCNTSRIIDFITQNENKIHFRLLNKAIENNIGEIRKLTYVHPVAMKNLNNTYNRIQINYPNDNLVSEDVILRLLACNDFEKVKELIEKSTKRVLEKLEILHREIKDSIEKLNSLEECNNSLKIARKKSRTSITKLLAGLLGIVTPLSIVSFIKSESLASRFTLKEKLYETSTKTYSENNTESESYHKLMETITWEKLKDIPASRTLEVLGEVKIEDGKVKRDYEIYDISSYPFDIPTDFYTTVYIDDPNSFESMKIDEGTRDASVDEYKYTDIIVTETIQDLENPKEVPNEEGKRENLFCIIFCELAITLVVSCCILRSLKKEIKKSIDKSKNIKTYNKNIEETNFTLMNLLNKSADNIAKCNDLCRKLTELLETSEMTKEETNILKKLERLTEQDNTLRKKLTNR